MVGVAWSCTIGALLVWFLALGYPTQFCDLPYDEMSLIPWALMYS